jgi:post-segregation antitoxin (ccd killing protein)
MAFALLNIGVGSENCGECCMVMLIYIDSGYIHLVYMAQVNVITVKVPSELKRKMKQLKVNWSKYIRDSIQKKIEEQKIKEASAKLDEVRARVKPVPTQELVSWIREDREK